MIKKKVVPFEKMSNRQKVVEVAKDVLKLLKLPNVKATTSSGYVKLPNWVAEKLGACGKSMKHYWRSILAFVPESEYTEAPVCTVCGIGSMLLAYVDRVNQFNLPEYGHVIDRKDTVEKLSEIMPVEQLALIEIAFEGTTVYAKEYISATQKTKALNFSRKFKTPKTCLIGIMNNIIKNEGVFKP